MKIYFVRHAEAEEAGDDALRKLTARGVEQSDKLGKFFKENEINFDTIFSSPLIRAVQTAEYIAMAIEPRKKPVINQTQFLLNETSQDVFNSFLKTLLKNERVLLVGHAPSLDGRVKKLLGINNNQSFKMPKASVACIETIDGITGALKFFISHKYI